MQCVRELRKLSTIPILRQTITSATTATESGSRKISNASSDRESSSHDTDLKHALLDRALGYIPETGWSKDCRSLVMRAARDMRLSPAAAGVLNYDGELVHYFMQRCNNQLTEVLQKEQGVDSLKIREKVALGIQRRLEMNIPCINTWSTALALAAQPEALVQTARLYAEVADIIWRFAGDTSVDFNYYTKRGLLLGAYTATELYMLSDCSPDFVDTWASLKRRIDDIMVMGKAAASFIPKT